MTHTVRVGKPVTKRGKIVDYKEIQTVPSNESFRYNRAGFATVPGDFKSPKKKPAAKKTAADKKPPADKTSQDDNSAK